MLRWPPIVQSTNARPCVDVGFTRTVHWWNECRDAPKIDRINSDVRQRSIPLWKTFDACWRWYCKSIFFNFDLADWIQIMVGNLPETPLEFGTIFRNTAWGSLDQERFRLATTGAHTQWPPKILLGYFDYKIFVAGRNYLHGKSLQLMSNFGVQTCLNFWSFASVM